MSFIRFVSATRHPDSGVEVGLLQLAYGVRDTTDVDADQREALSDHLAWFEKHLSTPDRFNRSRSKGYYRRSTGGIAYEDDLQVIAEPFAETRTGA